MPGKPTTTPKSWRDQIRCARRRTCFPMNSDDELRELGEDIEKMG